MLYYRERRQKSYSLLFFYFPIIYLHSCAEGGPHMLKESSFQRKLISELKQMFQGCLVLKLDPNYIQGLPDLLILYGSKWAALECKRAANSSVRPNQGYYVNLMNNLSFARFINPQNKEEVLRELQQTFFC